MGGAERQLLAGADIMFLETQPNGLKLLQGESTKLFARTADDSDILYGRTCVSCVCVSTVFDMRVC